jgi:hypothetical protein
VRALTPKADYAMGGLAYASRALPGGKASLIELSRLSKHESVTAVLKVWDEWSANKRRQTALEIACEAAGVEPAEFLSRTVEAAFKHNTDISKMLAAVNMPRVVGATVKNAMKERGFKDREVLLKHSGLLPTPGGQQINVQAIAQAKNQAAVVVPQNGLPSFEDAALIGMKAVRGAE